MISDSRRSSPVITAHLAIDQVGGRYCSDYREIEIVTAADVKFELVIKGVTHLEKTLS
jgi:hypothetical protein